VGLDYYSGWLAECSRELYEARESMGVIVACPSLCDPTHAGSVDLYLADLHLDLSRADLRSGLWSDTSGPGNATTLLSYQIYQLAFTDYITLWLCRRVFAFLMVTALCVIFSCSCV